jgi:hypothetical protein
MSIDLGSPLSILSDMDKILIAYDSNKILILDSINCKLHPWSLKNMHRMPVNFLKRYNRIVGITQLGLNKFALWTNYTYSVLDLEVEIPEEVQVV